MSLIIFFYFGARIVIVNRILSLQPLGVPILVIAWRKKSTNGQSNSESKADLGLNFDW